jgi:hypothetical protein
MTTAVVESKSVKAVLELWLQANKTNHHKKIIKRYLKPTASE